MGICDSSESNNVPTLLCFFEVQNEEQKSYCLKLKDNFHHSKTIKFEIKSIPNTPFSIKMRIRSKLHEIQKIYDNTEETMNNTLQAAYKLLDEENK
jgi:hypothetical protein